MPHSDFSIPVPQPSLIMLIAQAASFGRAFTGVDGTHRGGGRQGHLGIAPLTCYVIFYRYSTYQSIEKAREK